MNARIEISRAHSLVEHAIAYSSMEWPVIPLHGVVDGICTCQEPNCEQRGGHPKFSDGVGRKRNVELLASLFRSDPNANLGIATGTASGIFALRIDPATGGHDSLERLVTRNGTLPDTLTTQGFEQMVFKLPPGGVKLLDTLGPDYPGVSIRSDGDFIVAEPSRGPLACSWTDWEVGEPVEIAEAPAWLLDLARGKPDLRAAQDYEILPAEMRNSRRWLLWREEPGSAGKKPRKVPYYANGSQRSGVLDSPGDMANFATFEDALSQLQTGRYAGLGFALGPDGTGRCWQGIDLDDIPDRSYLTCLADDLPGYTEASPSGNGMHAIGHGRPFATLGSNRSGIEAYAAGRFFTVTATRAGNRLLTCLADFVESRLAPVHKPRGEPPSQAASEPGWMPPETVDDVTLAELRSALAAMPSDDRDLWQRIGHALRTLDSQGYALFTEWSQKSPKYDAADTERVWKSMHPYRTHWKAVFTEAQKAGWLNPKKSTASGPSGATPLPDAELCTYSFELPEFPPECLHGIVGDVVKLATLNTEAGVPGCAFATLALFGAAAGRNVYIEIGDGIKHLRPWGIVIGPTSTGRKGTSLELPLQLIQLGQEISDSKAGNLAGTGPRLANMNGVATGEGLIFAIRDGTDLVAGTQPRWQPIDDKRLLVIDEEFASTLAKCSRKDATLSATLRKGWDGRRLDNQTRSEPVAASRPHIVMLGQITPDEFLRKTETVELMNGLINRYMLILSKRNRSVPFPKPAPVGRVKDLAQRLAASLSFAWGGKHAFDPTAENRLRVTLSPEAETLYQRDYDRLTRERPGIVGGATGRMSTQVWIIAATYAVLDQSCVVNAEHMEAALGWARYGIDCAALLFNAKDNKKGAIEDAARAAKVFDAIRRSGSTGITRTQLSAEFAGHLSASMLSAAIQTLLGQRKISEQSDSNTGGRPATRYFAAQQ